MYAIVKTGGKQYRVEQGQTLLIERLPEPEGATVALEPLLYRSEDAVFDAKGLAGVEVAAKILSHERGEKLRVFKFKPKRGYKRRTGHRQELTQIEVTEIAAGRAKGSAKATAKPVAARSADSTATDTKATGEAAAQTPTASKEKAADGS
jgi:large subunit ribosomal protein L21